MLRRLLPAVCIVSLVLFSGCNKTTPDSIAKDMIAKFNEMTATLKGATDEASAKTASEKLKSLTADMKKLKNDGDALHVSKEEEKRVMDAYKKELETAGEALGNQASRILTDPKLGKGPLGDAIREMMTSLTAAK